MNYSNHSFFAILYLCLCLCWTDLLVVVNALPSGAANCVGGKAAVGVAHLEGSVTQGSLDKGGIVVSIDNHILTPGTTTVLPKGRDLTWSLNATKRPFRGFLVRAEDLTSDFETAVDTTESLSPLDAVEDDGDHVQVANTVCINAYRVGGVTHTNNNQKGLVSGLFRMEEEVAELQLDVTIVVKNRGGNSVFYYSGFVVSVQDENNIDTNNNGNANDEEDDEEDVEIENQDGDIEPLEEEEEEEEDKDKIDTLEETDSPVEEEEDTESPLTEEEPTDSPQQEEEGEATDSPLQDTNEEPQQEGETAATDTNEALVTGEGDDNDDGLPLILRASSCSDESPCNVCEGDCNKNSHCQDGLECFYRPDTTPIPGCIGDGVAGTDYCYMPRNDTLRLRGVDCSADNPCQACQGICMTDADCEGDDLFCFVRPDSTPVPGCMGDGVAGRNYCFYSTTNTTDTNDEANWPTRAPSPPTPMPTPPRPFSPNPPSMAPTAAPTKPLSTESPTSKPTRRPRPTEEPTMSPTDPAPTPKPTRRPRPERLTDSPTVYPTVMLTTQEPTSVPTPEPTSAATAETSYVPTLEPTFVPTLKPTLVPTVSTPRPTTNGDNTQTPSLRATFDDAFAVNNEDTKDKDKDDSEIDDDNEDDIDQSNISNNDNDNGQEDININDGNNNDVNLNGGNKALLTREVACSGNNPCNECEGDCNSDDDCLGTLQCFQRPDQTRVPGCNGLGVSGTDYCAVNLNAARPTELPPASPRPPTPLPTPQRSPPTVQPFQDDFNEDDSSNVILDNSGKALEDRNGRPCSQRDPCGECFGDCNADEDCEGQLRCYFRSDFEPVPGCAGQGSRGTDYCAFDMNSLSDNNNNNNNNNNNDNTINNGGGNNNDNDSSNNIVTNPGGSNLLNTRTAECTPSDPCGECQGDCDGDTDCAGVLQCFFRVGTEEVPGCLGSGVSGRDYCALNPQFQNRQRQRVRRRTTTA